MFRHVRPTKALGFDHSRRDHSAYGGWASQLDDVFASEARHASPKTYSESDRSSIRSTAAAKASMLALRSSEPVSMVMAISIGPEMAMQV